MFSPTPPNSYASVACLMFAKSSVCWNPIIYLILNPQFQSEFQTVFGLNLPNILCESHSNRKKRKSGDKLSNDRVSFDFLALLLIFIFIICNIQYLVENQYNRNTIRDKIPTKQGGISSSRHVMIDRPRVWHFRNQSGSDQLQELASILVSLRLSRAISTAFQTWRRLRMKKGKVLVSKRKWRRLKKTYWEPSN